MHTHIKSSAASDVYKRQVKEDRRQGRQRKRWEDNVREWTGLEFCKSQSAVGNLSLIHISEPTRQ